MPKVSVIMSTHNGLPYLKMAVQSILEQTYKNLEFIIVEDGSKDLSWKYLKKIRDKRIKLIKNSKKLGLAASLNKAIKTAKGKYIARMDADDISLSKRLETQVVFMQKNPTVDICGTWVKLIDENEKIITSIHKPIEDKSIKKMKVIKTRKVACLEKVFM